MNRNVITISRSAASAFSMERVSYGLLQNCQMDFVSDVWKHRDPLANLMFRR